MLAILVFLATPAHAAREVALTFDDLPNLTADEDSVATTGTIMQGIIGQLTRAHVPAIGFVVESKLLDEREQPDPRMIKLLDAWLAAGFDLGNHTFSHEPMSNTPLAAYEDDIVRGERISRPLAAQHGRPYAWFRFPFLDEGRTDEERDEVDRFLTDHGYRVAPVTIDNSEWIFALAWRHARHRVTRWRLGRAYVRYMEERFAWYEARSRGPQILLLHADALNAALLPKLLEMIRRRGYAFVTIDEAMREPVAEVEEVDDPQVPPWVQRLAGVTEQ